MAGKIAVTLVRSYSGRKNTQRLTLEALGLRRIGQTVVHNDSPGLQGQLTKVRHLISTAPAAQ